MIDATPDPGEPPVWFIPESSTQKIESDPHRLQSAAIARHLALYTKNKFGWNGASTQKLVTLLIGYFRRF